MDWKQYDFDVKVPCPACGAQVDSTAESCPKCGRQLDREAKRKMAHAARTKVQKRSPRDTIRDNVCASLCAMGLDAQMAERDLRWRGTLENVGDGVSLGLIEMRGSPIRWVNVLEQRFSYSTGSFTVAGSVRYYALYLVPDPNVCNKARLTVRSLRLKSTPVFGRVVGIRWTGKLEPGLVKRLNGNVSLNQRLLELKEDIKIRTVPKRSCWAIKSSSKWLQPHRRRFAPSEEQWDCYETIARHLLEPSGK